MSSDHAAHATTAEQHAMRAESLPAFRGFSLTHTRSQVAEALSHFGRLMIFEEYTKHDITHVDGLLQIYDWLIPPAEQEKLTAAEWLLLALGGYLHDFGLLVTRTEYEQRHATNFPLYKDQISQADGADDLDYRVHLERLPGDERERFLYQEFVRTNHARRIRSWLSGRPDKSLGCDLQIVEMLRSLTVNLDPVFVADLGVICESHQLDDLDNIDKYPLDRPYGQSVDEAANLQYVAIFLRAADLLHIRSDRTPTTAFRIISPRNPISQREWAKQRAVRSVRPKKAVDGEGNYDPNGKTDTIEIHARFTDADGFFGLTAYLQYAASQIRLCHDWANASFKRTHRHLEFPWKRIDTSNIDAEGFIASPFEFQLDQRKILDLLTGHTLYNDTTVVLRELLQNAIDAVRLQEVMVPSKTEPVVRVHWSPENGELTVQDNGTGMTQEIIEKNFLRVGSSLYQEQQFIKRHPGFSPISRFGIGALSAFMIADDVEVITVSPKDEQARLLTLRSVHGQYLIKLLNKEDPAIPGAIREHGTQVKLTVRPSAKLDKVDAQLKKWIVVPRCTVSYEETGLKNSIQIGHLAVKDALREVLTQRGIIEARGGKLYRWDDPVEIRQDDEFPGLSIAYAVHWNRWHTEWQLLTLRSVLGKSGYPGRPPAPLQLGTCIEGIRVTSSTPGYRGVTIAAIANATGRLAPKTDVARNSLELTFEFEDYVGKVYAAYGKHISTEVAELHNVRNCSLTKAAGEASYLASSLVDGSNNSYSTSGAVEFPGQLAAALDAIPAFVVEQACRRRSISMSDLRSIDELVTIDSPIMRHAEYLLAALPTTSSAGRLVRELGVGHLSFDNNLVLCSDLTDGYFADHFLDSWAPVKINVDQGAKTVHANWRRSLNGGSWVCAKAGLPAPPEFTSLIDYFSDNERRRSAFPYVATIDIFVEVVGLTDYDAVSLGSRTYLVPMSALYNIRSQEGRTSPASVAWFISWLSQAWTLRATEAHSGDRANGDAERLNRLMRILQTCNVDQHIDLDSVEKSLQGYVYQVFDVARWDRWSRSRRVANN